MIALPGALDRVVEDISAEIDAELEDAVHMVMTVDEVMALNAVNRLAQLVGDPAAVPHTVAVLATLDSPVVVAVGNVPLAIVREIQAQVPATKVLRLNITSAASELGYVGSIGWRDHEVDAHRRTWATIVRSATIELPAADAEPRDDASSDYMPFPVSALPSACRRIVQEGATAQGVDVAYWTVPLLGILAGCIGATRRVRIKRSWHEPAVIWSAVIAPSGAGKSPPLKELLLPVREHDQLLYDRTTALQQSAAAAAALNKNAVVERVPLLAALVGGVTIEALTSRLNDNKRGLLMPVDELAGWVKSWDAYRSGGDEQYWLSIHDAAPVKTDRKTNDERILVRSPAVSVTGTIQPGIAARYLGAAERRASGAAARLLLAMPPLARVQWTDDDISEEAREQWGFVVRSLLDLTLDDKGLPATLAMDDEARAQWIVYHDENGDACYRANLAGDGDTAAALSKLRGGAARLALVLALARAAEDGTAALLPTISGEAMQAGITIARWFDGEARRVYALWDRLAADRTATDDRATLRELAERLWEIMASGPKSRDQLHDATGRNHTAPRLDAALEILRCSGRAASEKGPRKPQGGRPPELWRRTGGVS